MKHLFIFALLCSTTFEYAFAQTQSCPFTNNQIVVNGDEIFSVKLCILHPITDIQIYNSILSSTDTEPTEISDEQYAQLPIGSLYTAKDFTREFGLPEESKISDLCQNYDQQIVSSDNTTFYYIENCQKKKFLDYTDVESFTNVRTSGGIAAISDFDLKNIKRGRNISVPKLKLYIEKTDLEIAASLPTQASVCALVKEKAPSLIVSYYSSMFYFQNCVLHRITDLTVDLMQQADEAGGIYELSTREILSLPEGPRGFATRQGA